MIRMQKQLQLVKQRFSQKRHLLFKQCHQRFNALLLMQAVDGKSRVDGPRLMVKTVGDLIGPVPRQLFHQACSEG